MGDFLQRHVNKHCYKMPRRNLLDLRDSGEYSFRQGIGICIKNYGALSEHHGDKFELYNTVPPQGNDQCERYNGIIWKTVRLYAHSHKLDISN